MNRFGAIHRRLSRRMAGHRPVQTIVCKKGFFAKMTSPTTKRRFDTRWLAGAAALLAVSPMLAPPVLAQTQSDEARLRKIEAEVRALQRRVFPGSDGTYFEPEITAATPTTPQQGPETSGPVTDLLTRMDAVESALARLTAQSEVNTNALQLLNARVEALEEAQATAVAPVTGLAPPPGTPGASQTATLPVRSAAESNLSAMAGTPVEAARPPAEVIEKPQTDDAGDDAYVYGYRLWEARRYAEARAQLQAMIQAYPNHRRASWARNLIGRAWLDEGQPRQAAEAFLANYLANKSGERAPDSLVYLGIATLQLGNATKACEALEEFRIVYPAEAAGRLSTLAGQTSDRARCN